MKTLWTNLQYTMPCIWDFGWTNWYNQDKNFDGSDSERYDNLPENLKCPNDGIPIAAECRTVDTHVYSWNANQNLRMNCRIEGMMCFDADNMVDNGEICHDYEVRYLCQGDQHGIIFVLCIKHLTIGSLWIDIHFTMQSLISESHAAPCFWFLQYFRKFCYWSRTFSFISWEVFWLFKKRKVLYNRITQKRCCRKDVRQYE